MTRAYRFVDGDYLEGDFEFMPEPAGSVSTTASDMSRFMLAHLQGGHFNEGRILKEETIRQMHSQQFTHHPKLDGMAFGFIESTINGQRILSHGGSTMLFDSGLYLLPDKNIGIFISYSGSNYLVHTELFQQFMDRYFPISYSLDLLPAEGAIERSHRFVGEYQMNRRNITTSDRLLSLMMGVIHIDVDENGYLLANHYGETNRFVEVEPGIYHNLREGRTQDPVGSFRTLVFGTDPYGRTMLISDGPMTYSKAPWYATGPFTLFALIAVLLILIVSLIYWFLCFLIGLFKRNISPYPKLANTAQWTAVAFSTLTLVLFGGFLATAKIHPLYQLPREAFDNVPSSPLLELIPVMLLSLGFGLVLFTIFAWCKRYWRIISRIHYSVFTASSLGLLWLLYYWNVF